MLLILVMFSSVVISSASPEPGFFGSLFDRGTELPPTPNNLFVAASDGDLETVKDLVARGADVETSYNAPLSIASRNGHIEVVKFLLSVGANPNATNDEEYSSGYMGKVLQNAARTNQLEIIDLLLKAGATPTPPEYSAGVLDRASENGHVEAVQKLLDAGADPNYGRGYSFLLAAKHGHLDVVKAYISAGGDPNTGGGWILNNAAKSGHFEIVKALLAAGASELDSALTSAAQNGSLPIVNILLERGADVNKYNALKEAATEGSVEVARALLEAGANFSYDGDLGSALHLAASHGHIGVIRLIVQYGGNINRPLIGDTWWDYRPSRGSRNYGKGWTVIHTVAKFGFPIIKELVELGAVIDIKDDVGLTPLHVAVSSNKIRVVEQLLKFCVDATAITPEGKTVLDLAQDEIQNYNASLNSEHRKLMNLIESVLQEKIASMPYNMKSIRDLRNEFDNILETNITLQAQMNETKKSLYKNEAIMFLFDERNHAEMLNIIEENYCKTSAQDIKTITFGTMYLAKCECIQGQGTKFTLTPLQDGNQCLNPPSEGPADDDIV